MKPYFNKFYILADWWTEKHPEENEREFVDVVQTTDKGVYMQWRTRKSEQINSGRIWLPKTAFVYANFYHFQKVDFQGILHHLQKHEQQVEYCESIKRHFNI